MTTHDLWEHGPAVAAQWPIWGLLCDARSRSGLSIEELAGKTGIPVAELDDFEHARMIPAIEVLYSIISACGLEMRILLTKPDAQLGALRTAAKQRTVEERIATNESAVRTMRELRKGLQLRPAKSLKAASLDG